MGDSIGNAINDLSANALLWDQAVTTGVFPTTQLASTGSLTTSSGVLASLGGSALLILLLIGVAIWFLFASTKTE